MYSIKYILSTIAVIAVLVSVQAQTDYCKISQQHVACNNDGSYGKACGSQYQLVNMNLIKSDVLASHNNFRNIIAGGDQKPYTPGVRIGAAQWDAELATLAEMHVKKCIFQHDIHGTQKFPISGQNLAQSCWYGTSKTDKDVVLKHIAMWYNEYKDGDMSYINSYKNPTNGKVIGHFTAVVNEKNNYLGCASIKYKQGQYDCIMTTCNYSSNNILGKPIYVAGSVPGSSCKSRDSTFKNLCSTSEVYNYTN